MRKQRGDATLFTPGVDRRDFLRRLGASSAAASMAASTLAATAPSRPTKTNRPTMLEELNHELFKRQIGSAFEGRVGGREVRFELIEARSFGPQKGRPEILSRREPFSLIFRAPSGTAAPQQIYELTHQILGRLCIFLVPVGADEHGALYEAVFN